VTLQHRKPKSATSSNIINQNGCQVKTSTSIFKIDASEHKRHKVAVTSSEHPIVITLISVTCLRSGVQRREEKKKNPDCTHRDIPIALNHYNEQVYHEREICISNRLLYLPWIRRGVKSYHRAHHNQHKTKLTTCHPMFLVSHGLTRTIRLGPHTT
jgi:hypothetical protein